jgi:hypothetical protein
MIGKAVKYLETREPGEFTIFQLIDQEGPCQIGAWYDAARLIFGRLGETNALVAWPTARNNYLGKGDRLGAMKVAAYVLSDVIAEVRSALRCLARDPQAALATLDEMEKRLVAASGRGLLATERELRQVTKATGDRGAADACRADPASIALWRCQPHLCGCARKELLRRARHSHQNHGNV